MQNLLDSIQHEVNVVKHLATKVPEGKVDWRPTEGQRSIGELMQYLTICGSGPAEALISDDWSVIAPLRDAAATMRAEDFPGRMADQRGRITELLEGLSDDDLLTREAPLPWGGTMKLGAALVNLPLKFLASYRLQLFNHIKASGAPDLDTANAWVGVDATE